MTFGVELRRRRVAAGLSLDALAKLVHYSKSHLSKVETGAKPPSVALARQCDAVLSSGGELVALVPAPPAEQPAGAGPDIGEDWFMSLSMDGRNDFGAMPRRMLLASGVAGLVSWTGPPAGSARRVDVLSLSSFQSILHEVRALGQVLDPEALLPVLIAQTHTLRVMATRCQAEARNRTLALAARFAEYTGWIAQEAGDDSRALWWTDRAVELAEAGGDMQLATYAWVRRALVTLYRQDPVATVTLAGRAQADQAHPRIRGLAAGREAQGHALAGDYDRCLRVLDQARRFFELAASEGDGLPVLGTTTVQDPVEVVTGWCLLDLGRPEPAVEILRAEVARIPHHAHRSRARYGARLALALASAGDPGAACTAVEPVLDAVSMAPSATIRTELANLARTLRRWHSDPAVRQIMPRLAAVLNTISG